MYMLLFICGESLQRREKKDVSRRKLPESIIPDSAQGLARLSAVFSLWWNLFDCKLSTWCSFVIITRLQIVTTAGFSFLQQWKGKSNSQLLCLLLCSDKKKQTTANNDKLMHDRQRPLNTHYSSCWTVCVCVYSEARPPDVLVLADSRQRACARASVPRRSLPHPLTLPPSLTLPHQPSVIRRWAELIS